jgi:pimeloyl-ACP methyl ester carboxylesterase
MKRYFFDTSYGQIHYIVEGPSSGSPVILLHQTPRSIDEYAEVIPILAQRYLVIAVDTLGYGNSDKPKDQPTIADYAETVRQLLDALKIEQANLVGHHTGAFIAMELAAAYPARVSTLANSGPIYMDEEARQLFTNQAYEQWHVKADGSHYPEHWQRFTKWIADPAKLHRIVLDVMRAGEISEYGHYACFAYRMEDRLPLIQCPTLLIIGKKDIFAMMEKNRIFPKILPQAKEVYIEGGGIFLPTEKPEEFARLVMDFLQNPTA